VDAKLNSSETRARLEAAVLDLLTEASSAAPMQWGRDDCALWAVEPVRRALAIDAATRFRGHYRTRIGALRLLGKGGLASALRAAARWHRWRRIPPSDAQTGDLGLIHQEAGYAMVVCRATGWFVGRNERGFTAVPAESVKIAFDVLPGDAEASA